MLDDSRQSYGEESAKSAECAGLLIVSGSDPGISRKKGNVKRAVEVVAMRLGNTAAICRKCYIHPVVVDAYLEGKLVGNARSRRSEARRAMPFSGGAGNCPRSVASITCVVPAIEAKRLAATSAISRRGRRETGSFERRGDT